MMVKHLELMELRRNEKLSYVAGKSKLVKSFRRTIGQCHQPCNTHPLWSSNSTLRNYPKAIIMKRRMMHRFNDKINCSSIVLKWRSNVSKHYVRTALQQEEDTSSIISWRCSVRSKFIL